MPLDSLAAARRGRRLRWPLKFQAFPYSLILFMNTLLLNIIQFLAKHPPKFKSFA